MEITPDRRKYPRYEVQLPVLVFAPTGTVAGQTKDISLKGLSLQTVEPLQLNCDYTIELMMAEQHGIRLTGRIIWSDTYEIDDRSQTVAAGIAFLEIAECDRRAFENLAAMYLEE